MDDAIGGRRSPPPVASRPEIEETGQPAGIRHRGGESSLIGPSRWVKVDRAGQ